MHDRSENEHARNNDECVERIEFQVARHQHSEKNGHRHIEYCDIVDSETAQIRQHVTL